MKTRKANIKRKTKETEILINLKLNSLGDYDIKTGDEFFDHMLSQLAKHGNLDLAVRAKGDDIPDAHHLVEDVGIVLGDAFKKALDDKKGINRYGFGSAPMDDALVAVSVDFAGRPFLVYNSILEKKRIGYFDDDLAEEFFKAFTMSSGATLHLHKICGKNPHHILESAFKSFGRAIREAVTVTGKTIPSTKGSL
ncbi:MAG: imidazoleglycerol-phosphate dehydratase HisB [Candidatus Firestonebacteria bacterium]